MGKAIVGLVLLLGLTSCAPANPAQPAPVTPTAAVPASITLTSVSGSGASAGTIDVDATVQDASGRGVPGAIVTFTTTAGSMAIASMTADGGGLAQANLTTTIPATVTATSGTISAHLGVTPLAPPAVFVTPPYIPSPAPTPITPPVTTPPITTPAPTFTVSATCTPAAHGSATVCNLTGVNLGVPLRSSLYQTVTWDWGDGTIQNVSFSPLGSNTYLQAGTYHIGILVVASPMAQAAATLTATTSASVVIP